MQKAYNRTYWENLPSENTEIDADNLNNIESGIDELDNRILTIDLTKLNKTSASAMMTGFALDTETGVITLTFFDGSKKTINTNLGKIALNITYDHENERLVLTMPDGSVTYVDMSALITQYEFVESDEIWFEVTAGGKVKASIKDGSITEQKLRPNFLADIKTESAKAATSAQSASASANAAAISEANAKKSADSAAESEEKAKLYADNASAVTGIEIAKKDRAGIIKGGENHIAEDGTLTLTKRTTTPTLYNSHAGGIKLNGLGGVSEQERTTGKNLLDCSGLVETTTNGVTFTPVYDARGSLLYIEENGTATANAQYYIKSADSYELPDGDYIFNGADSSNTRMFVYLNNQYLNDNGEGVNFSISGSKIGITAVVIAGTTVTKHRIYPMIRSASVEDGSFEPYTGRQPRPNPDYPQEIKRVKGKNELDCRGLVEQTTNGVTFTPVYDAYGNLEYVNVNGTATDRANYSLNTSFPLSTGSYIYNGVSGGSALTYGIYIGGITYVSNGDTSFEVSDGTFNTYISVFAGATLSNVKIYPMIRKATIADPTYVPYGLLRIKGHGKNHINPLTCEFGLLSNENVYATTNWITSSWIKVKPNTEYAFSSSIIDGGLVRYNQFDKNRNFIAQTMLARVDKVTLLTEENCEYVRLSFGSDTAISDLETWFQENAVQFEEGSESTEIEPYTEQSVILSQPIELNGNNGVADELVSGTKRFAKVVFDGSDDENIAVFAVDRNMFTIDALGIKIMNNTTTVPNLKSTHFIPVTQDDLWGKDGSHFDGISVRANNYQILIRLDGVTTVEDLRSWLAENPIEVTYELAEPIIEPLPTADQIALHSLMSYDGVTYLTCDSEIQPTWDLEYGTSKVGAYTLDAWNTAKRSEIKQEAKYNEVVSALLTLNQE